MYVSLWYHFLAASTFLALSQANFPRSLVYPLPYGLCPLLVSITLYHVFHSLGLEC